MRGRSRPGEENGTEERAPNPSPELVQLLELPKEGTNGDSLDEAANLKKLNESLAWELKKLQEKHHEKVAELNSEMDQLREENSRLRQERAARPEDNSEARLREALVNRSTSTEDLREAIAAVDSLLEEAKRELRQKELRARRAAVESLHSAMALEDEEQLATALAEARRCDVHRDDIEKAEVKLDELHNMSPEQRATKQAARVLREKKKEAYLLVRRDHADELQELLEGLDADVRWQDWKDFQGRTLLKFSQAVHAPTVQALLRKMLCLPEPAVRQSWLAREDSFEDEGRQRKNSKGEPFSRQPSVEFARAETPPQSPETAAETAPTTPNEKLTPSGVNGSGAERGGAFADRLGNLLRPRRVTAPAVVNEGTGEKDRSPSGSSTALCMSPALTVGPDFDTEYHEPRVKAFRAVAQDDCDSLLEVLDTLSVDVWSKWQNKAGKDLITLSQERGSSWAYSVLARALGLLKEQVRESYEERETVWVFEVGEVQPRRATVMEDTSEEADQILVEFWDDNSEPMMVESCLVRKMGC
mmetsp:Transcript_49337/g.117376  ORF Transcript_49337/g.117376 Transcript_49337/m.117376 type:complete len:532 (+) Transcript_49337:107-1702(+)